MNKRYVGPALRADWESLGNEGQALARALHDFDCDCGSYADGEYTDLALRTRAFLAGYLSYELDLNDQAEGEERIEEEEKSLSPATEDAILHVDWATLSAKRQNLTRALHDFDCGCNSYHEGKCDSYEYPWVTDQVLGLLGWS